MLNILQPAVLRQFYGLKVDDSCLQRCWIQIYLWFRIRCIFSRDGSPQFCNKDNDGRYDANGNRVIWFIGKNTSYFQPKSSNIDNPFDHCTVIVFYAGNDLKNVLTLGLQSDCVYSAKDGCLKNVNSWVKNLPTIISTQDQT